MNPVKEFEFFIGNRTVMRVTPDFNRAAFLKKEAERRLVFLRKLQEKIGVSEDNANYVVENCYNILSETLRAKMLEAGYYASGQGAHEAEVSFMDKLLFPYEDISFMNDLRYFRNGILYYGKILNKEYAEKVVNFMNKTYPKLKNAARHK